MDESPLQSENDLPDLSPPLPPEENSGPSLFLVLSLLTHILLLLFLLPFLGELKRDLELKNKKSEAPTITEFILKDPSKPPLEIADIPKPEKEETPDQAKFAALYNQKVKKETVAPSTAPSAMQKKTSPQKKSKEKEEKTQDGAVGETNKKEANQNSENVSDQRVSESALLEDYYPDYTVGGHTFVNALRYPNIQYFVELKRRFKTAFNPITALREHRNELKGNRIEVVLGVTLDPSGNLKDLIMIRNSYLSAYDETALETIRRSAPFRSPPANLLDKDKLLRMSWTFTVYF